MFEIKGTRIGGAVPRTVVSLMADDLDGLLCEAERATAQGADCLEWRADCFGDGTASGLARVASCLDGALPATPLIFTLRSVCQGGRSALPHDVAASVVEAVIGQGVADLVDVESCWGDEPVRRLVAQAHGHGLRAIVSEHVFGGTPPTSWMVDRLLHLVDLGADIPKLAVMAKGKSDCLRLMEATAHVAETVEVPLLTMAMGEAGTFSRLAGECFGSALTFCALDRASAPGQVGLALARRTIDVLHDALGAASA